MATPGPGQQATRTPGGGGEFNLNSAGCFPAGTEVTLADGSRVPIESLTKGQMVRASEFAKQTGAVGDLIERESEDLYTLTAEAVPGTGAPPPPVNLRITGDHVVWSDSVGWKAARDLEVGEWIHHESGTLMQVMSLNREPGKHTVYTIEVDRNNAFFAGGILVQDLCGYQKSGDKSMFSKKEVAK